MNPNFKIQKLGKFLLKQKGLISFAHHFLYGYILSN